MNSWGTVQHVSRMALMLTLGGAAALKLYAETATVAAYGLRNASVLAVAAASFEVALAWCFLTGRLVTASAYATITMALIGIAIAAFGRGDCGCLGRVALSPMAHAVLAAAVGTAASTLLIVAPAPRHQRPGHT